MPTIPETLQTALTHHQAGRLAEAEALYRQILQAQPDHPDALHLLGVIAHQGGKHDVAVEYIARAIALNPIAAEYHCNIGEAYRALARLNESEVHMREALRLEPNSAVAHGNLGVILFERGKVEEAVAQYRNALAVRPTYAEAHNNLGVALKEQGKLDEAFSHYRQALALHPTYAEAKNNAGVVLREQGRLAEAIAYYREALALKPAYVEAFYNLADALCDQGKQDDAITMYGQALTLNPSYVQAYNNLGLVFQGQGKLAEAAEQYRRALKFKPGYWEAHNNLGIALRGLGHTEDAIAHYRLALTYKPTAADVYRNLGTALKDQGKVEEAKAHYQKALALQPNDGLRILLATVLPVIPQSKEHILAARRHFEAEVSKLLGERLSLVDPCREVGATNFYLAYHGLNDRELQVQIAQLYERACPSLLYTAPHCVNPERKRATDKIKVGFVSRFFTTHSVAKSFQGLFAHLPRERFTVCAIFVPPVTNDEVTKTFRECADVTIVLSGVLSDARERIAREELDVLFYTDIGMEPFTYFLAFSRLAPVQCVAGGHPATTGIRNLDYYISCDDLEPEGAEDHYSERLVRLKGLPVYYYRPEQSPSSKSRGAFGLEEGRTIYLCPQSLFKVHPDFDEIVGELLQADPNGLVVFVEGNVQHWTELLMRRFRKNIPKVADRIRFLPRQSYTDFLRLLTIADVLLDTVHFGGGTTTFQGLAYGTPIVTLPGQFPGGRTVYACYRKLGMMDCVAASKAGYVKLAVRLGTDPAFRERVKAKILANNHVLYENLDGVREYERFFLRAVKQSRSLKKGRA